MNQVLRRDPPASTEPAGTLAFGWRIRALRRKAGLTLQALADQAGISVGFLSQVERDKATPSLGTLANLAAALGIDLDRFVATPRPADGLTRSDARPTFSIGGSSLSYERLTTDLPAGAFTSLIIHIPVGYRSEIVAHEGEELIVVLSGTVRQTLGASAFVLSVGDALHFMGDTPHSFANDGPEPARLLWTGTSPRLLRRTGDEPPLPSATKRRRPTRPTGV
jgi:transcriptional regulator with XRE-family HTH domain